MSAETTGTAGVTAAAWRQRPLSATRRLHILERLAAGDGLSQAALATGQLPDHVQSVAADAGYPDATAVYTALAALRRQQGLDSGRPAGAPVPPRNAPAAGPRLCRIPLTQLHPDPANIRRSLRSITEMAQSMNEVGLLQPITARVHEGHLMIVIGHRRYAAAQRLGWAAIDVIINRQIPPEDVLSLMLAENTHRCDLDPIEEALAVRRLINDRRLASHAQAGALLGHATSWVSARLALLDLSPRDQELVRSQQMTLTEATRLARKASGRTRGTAAPQPPHFGAAHPLAALARGHCRGTHLAASRLPGLVACGPCWEHVIRAAPQAESRPQADSPAA